MKKLLAKQAIFLIITLLVLNMSIAWAAEETPPPNPDQNNQTTNPDQQPENPLIPPKEEDQEPPVLPQALPITGIINYQKPVVFAAGQIPANDKLPQTIQVCTVNFTVEYRYPAVAWELDKVDFETPGNYYINGNFTEDELKKQGLTNPENFQPQLYITVIPNGPVQDLQGKIFSTNRDYARIKLTLPALPPEVTEINLFFSTDGSTWQQLYNSNFLEENQKNNFLPIIQQRNGQATLPCQTTSQSESLYIKAKIVGSFCEGESNIVTLKEPEGNTVLPPTSGGADDNDKNDGSSGGNRGGGGQGTSNRVPPPENEPQINGTPQPPTIMPIPAEETGGKIIPDHKLATAQGVKSTIKSNPHLATSVTAPIQTATTQPKDSTNRDITPSQPPIPSSQNQPTPKVENPSLGKPEQAKLIPGFAIGGIATLLVIAIFAAIAVCKAKNGKK